MDILFNQIKKHFTDSKRFIAGALVISSLFALAACGESSSTQSNINLDAVTSSYAGPDPKTDDIREFKNNFWQPLSADNRCGGSCHLENGRAPTPFVHQGDVNTAYLAAVPLVDLDTYSNSDFVTKVAGGHNCWLSDNNACADIIESLIAAWKGGQQNSAGRQIVLNVPPIKDPGASKNFPALATDVSVLNDSFAETVYPLLIGAAKCSDCHTETSPTATSPFFANPGNVNSSYEAAKAKINLDSPADSRFVLRLRDEFHNCWTSSCANDADTMQTAIEAFADPITPTFVDPALITSKALNLADATIATGGSRYETNTIALWEFKTGGGSDTFDTSGIDPAVNLSFSGNITWILGDGIEIISGSATALTGNSQKLYDLIRATGEYSIETWVVPGNVSQQDSSIISYAAGGGPRNFAMAQDLYNYTFLNRTEDSDANGNFALTTADADEDLQASLQHVVMNFDPTNGRQIFVNGAFTGDVDSSNGGSLNDWNPSYSFSLGNEPGGQRLWKGKIRMVAIHNRILTPFQITQNFSVGVGKKYFMLFSIGDRIGIPGSYILFHVEQYDNYAYLFNQPRFINLDKDWVPTGPITIKGMRIAINGQEATAAQAFANLDATVNSTDYDFTNNGQFLSDRGTIIPLGKGPASDEFFLTFEELTGTPPNPFVETSPTPPTPPGDPADTVSDIGLRIFEEINATMSDATGILTTQPTVNATYNTYRQQLPVVEDINTFLASHQMAVAQLAMSYCSVLVDTNPGYFSGFTFDTADIAFDSQPKRDAVINPLLAAIMNVDTATPANSLLTQPDGTEIRNMLGATGFQDLDLALAADPNYEQYNSLIDCMTRCAAGPVGAAKCPIYFQYDINGDLIPASTACTATEVTSQTIDDSRTKEVVKATCAATLGSAAMLIQ